MADDYIGLRIEVVRYSLTPGGEGGRRKQWDRPERLAAAGILALNHELFWGEVDITVGDAQFGGHCHVLDTVWGWYLAGREMARSDKHVFRSAEGSGDYEFRRRGDDAVLVHLRRGPKALVSLADLQERTGTAAELLIKDLKVRYPPLASNAALRELSGRLSRRDGAHRA